MQKLFVTGVKVGSFAVALPPASGMTPGWAPYPFERISLVFLIFLMIQSLSSELWDVDGGWNFDKLSFVIPTFLKSSILAAPRPLVTHQEDGVLWQPSKNGVFDSGLTYSIALDLEIPKAPSLDWKWLWKIQIIPRVSSFLWLACLDKLPTCSFLTSCKIITDDSCPLCKSALESLLHSLRDCLVVLPIWKEPLLIGWSPPPTGFVKLNSDGSALGNPGSAGAGGVLQDCSGKWISGFAPHIGFTTSFVAELWGLRDGLMLARQLDVSKIVIEIDAKSLIQLFKVALIQHTHCEGNYCADLLAKAGNSSSTPFSVFDVPPTFVVSQYLADALGVYYTRYCNPP
uniref:RNase H type-1 domain-containing protein n=1 Tax=Fagus sylvatica TaxID=28930 RepID=A0A2N9G7T7_FAGSY